MPTTKKFESYNILVSCVWDTQKKPNHILRQENTFAN